MNNEVTGAEAGLTGNDQIMIALKTMEAHGGVARISDIYAAVEAELGGRTLSDQGKASLRYFVNTNAIRAGFVYPHDPDNPGWRITPEGREFLAAGGVTQEVIDVDTGQPEEVPVSTVASAAFERAVLTLLKQMYPHYTWYYQGRHKHNERGLDFVGAAIGEQYASEARIGVQVKFHAENNAPTQMEWLKFLAGCFARRVGKAIFVTTGRLTGEQRREAGEADVIVVEGLEGLLHLCSSFGVDQTIFTELVTERAAGDVAA